MIPEPETYQQQLARRVRERDAQIRAAEDELGALRWRVAELTERGGRPITSVPLICCDERHQERVTALTARVEQAEARIAAARALHAPYRSVYDEGDSRSCSHCNQLTGHAVSWPCPTIAALDGTPEAQP